MKISKKSVIQGLLFTAPIVLNSTIGISPGRAASLALSTASLTLENFNRPGTVSPSFPAADTVTLTSTEVTDGTVIATANASAIVTIPPNPTRITQSSDARVEEFGRRFSGFALGGSLSNLEFDTEDGLFRFDFAASLSAIRSLTDPGERSTATSFVGFQILDTADNEIDFFEASLAAGNPFTVRNSSFVQFTIAETSNTVSGFYARQFAAGTQLKVRGVTLTTAAVTVPEPSMFAALLILPGLMRLKKAVNSRDRQFD